MTIWGPSISALFTNPILKQTALSLDSDTLNPTFSELLPHVISKRKNLEQIFIYFTKLESPTHTKKFINLPVIHSYLLTK